MSKLPRLLVIASIVVGGTTLSGAGRSSAETPASTIAPANAGTYTVRAGDSLYGIARRHGVSMASLLAANGLTVSSVIHPGQSLIIPAGGGAPTPTAPPVTAPPPATGTSVYTVRRGDSLYGIARRLGVTMTSLLAVNRLTVSSVIHPGQSLAVPSPTPSGGSTPPPTAPPTTTPPTTPPTNPAPATGTYTVRAGDSLYGISRRLGVSFSSLLSANGLTATSLIHPGRSLIIPTGGGSAPPATAPLPSSPSPISSAEAERIIREVWPDDLEQMAVDIARRESRLRPTAQNGCCVGLFQIYYDLHSWWLAGMGINTRDALFDARTNAQAALALYQRGGWTPWAVAPAP